MKHSPRVVSAVLALLVAAGCSTSTAGSPDGASSDEAGGQRGATLIARGHRERAPLLAGTTLKGRKLSSAEYSGKTLVVNLWASWCGPCRAEEPVLSKAARKLSTSDVAFVGILTQDSRTAALAFTRKRNVPYPSLSDEDGRLALALSKTLPGVGVPTTWIIDADGNLAARYLGYFTSTSTLTGMIKDTQRQ